MSKRNVLPVLAALFLGCFAGVAQPADLSKTVILVAKPELRADPFYGSAVLVVTSIGGEQHAGFIVNRPTSVTLGSVFPGDGPAQKVVDPVYVGGPVDSDVIFALVPGSDGPGKGSIQLMPGVFAALNGKAVDRAIAADPEGTRFLAGLVVWKPGELQEEIRQGLWYVLEADPAVVLPPSTVGLWEELARRSKIAADAI
jgi:putative transcriptional regulator